MYLKRTNKIQGIIGLLFVMVALGISGCGNDNSGIHGQNPAPAAKDSNVSDNANGDHAVPGTSDNSSSSQKSKSPVKAGSRKNHVKKQAPTPPPTETVDETAQPVAIIAPTPTPAPTAQPAPSHFVVGLGTTSQDPSALLDRGYNAAILDARFCSATGKFSNGSQCYAVFNDGKTEWVDARNRTAIQDFIAELEKASAAKEAEKKAKKEMKKKNR